MRNIIKTYVMLLLVCSAAISAHAQKWLWAHSGGSNQLNMPDRGFGLALGEKDTIFNLGAFSGQLQLDVNHNMGLSVARFIAKYAPDGTPIASSLIKGISSGGVARALGFGSFNKKIFFVSGDIDGSYYFDTVIASGGGGGYIAKFDKNTRCKWVKIAVSDDVQSMAFDDRGSMYIIGSVTQSIAKIDTFKMYSSGSGYYTPLMYIAKLDSEGKCIWARQSFGGRYWVKNIVLSNNNLYFWGRIDSCVNFDALNVCASAGATSLVVCTDTAGRVQWHSVTAASKSAHFSKVTTDALGNCYALGWYDSTLTLSGKSISALPGSYRNLFLVKYSPLGDVEWLRPLNTNTDAVNKDIYTDAHGNTYVVGTFTGTATFGNHEVSETKESMFIARYDANGNCLGIKAVPNAKPEAVTSDDSGNAIVTGSIRTGTTRFDDIERTSNGGDDYFIAKLSAITGSGSTVKAVTLNDKLIIYANPNRGIFTIDVPEGIATNATARLNIFDNAGRLVKEETVGISSPKVEVDLGTVLKGLYTVTLSGNGSKKFTGKVMVE